MLDQNTDRMWFVIGALVVGAGIILLANQFVPEVFASMSGGFQDTMGKANDGIRYELMGYVDVEVEMLEGISGESIEFGDFNQSENNFIVGASDYIWSGVILRPSNIEGKGWKPDTKYEITYTIEAIDGDLLQIQNEVANRNYVLSESRIYVDGDSYSLQAQVSLDPTRQSHDIRLVTKTRSDSYATNMIVIRPNGGITVPVTVRITNLVIREL